MSDLNSDKFQSELEHLIVRQLDGAIGSDEELALNRGLIRDPQARQLADDYRKIDDWATAALESAVLGSGAPFEAASVLERVVAISARRSSYSRSWWLLPAAIAAALGFAVMTRETSTLDDSIRVAARPPLEVQPTTNVHPWSTHRGLQADSVRRASGLEAEPMRSLKRNVDRDLLGVLGDDGNIYWLEVDRTKIIHEPDRSSAVRRASGDL